MIKLLYVIYGLLVAVFLIQGAFIVYLADKTSKLEDKVIEIYDSHIDRRSVDFD